MRKIILIIVVVAIFLMLSCGYPTTANDVVAKFFESLKSEQFEQAKKYATQTGGENVDFASSLGLFDGIADWAFVLPEFAEAGEEVTSDYVDHSGATKVIKLIKDGTKWKVDQFMD